ncbi:B-cell receptor CD22-like [Dendropsophus ebraccatus]|uniref:B-cell receptor CD22-like n=1 Tax=Dendropsophus ebraccatus TaxID=150705 RepID=UPI0038316628
MAGVNQMFLLIVFQGFYSSSVCQWWSFPRTVAALIGSCVEIPCTYDPAGTPGAPSTVWYLYAEYSYPQILNTKDPSSVIKQYSGRTSQVPGEKSCTLRIDPVRREDGKQYYYPGIAEDKYINAYDNHGTVHLDVMDFSGNVNIVSEKKKSEDVFTIRCTTQHTCRSAPPNITWNKPGDVKKNSVKRYEAYWIEESELTYIPSYMDDGSPVQCTATYPGKKTQKSKTLNINYSPKNVTVTVIGMDEVMEGSDVTLQCNSFSNPGAYDYEWYKGKEKFRLPERGREITVRNVTRDMEPYSCTARNPVGRGESALTHIPVLYAPKNVSLTIGMGGVMEGSDVTLQCNSFSNPDVSEYEWYKGKEKLPERGREITVRNVTRDMEPYSCTARNSIGRGESAIIEIPVLYSPKNVTFTVIVIGMGELMEGSDVTLQCNSFSKPNVTEYEWYKGKEKLLERGREITVRNVTRDMEPYSCTAINPVGRGESALTQIPVLYAAVGVHITWKEEPEYMEMSCNFSSSRPAVTHYTWMKDGSILHNKTEKTLTLYNNEENNGQYSCIAHNSAGDPSSEEICMKCNNVNLSLILGTVAAVFLLIFFILVIYIVCLRQTCKSYCLGSSKRPPTAARSLSNNTRVNDDTLKEENQYGNIQSHHNNRPDTMRPMPFVDVNIREDYVIYSNSEAMKPKNDVEYCEISHVQRNQITLSGINQEHSVEYATLRH